ncbi:MAG: response regulator [Planctomycetota bacterium]|jgi:CheY-like chemotaxis protein
MAAELASVGAEFVRLIPSVLWFSLVVTLLVLFYEPIRKDLLPNLKGFKAMGVEFSFVKESIDAALELAEKSPQWEVAVTQEDKENALRRARKHLPVFRDAQILWVDDHPENNLNERRMFRRLRAEIDIARSTEEALEILKNGRYDLVISDMARGEKATAGLTFLRQFRKTDDATPVIFYIGMVDAKKGVPARAFGITNRPDELLHLTLDALERRKY